MMIARAITTRCFWPPERSRGVLVDEELDRRQPDALERVDDPGAPLGADCDPVDRAAGRPTASSIVIAGLSAAFGSWKTICMSVRGARAARWRRISETRRVPLPSSDS